MRENIFNVTGRVVAVTGGAGVLGGAIAEGFAAAGARVALLGRTVERLEYRAAELRRAGGECMPLPADVLDKERLVNVRADLLAEWGRVDVLVNVAGGNVAGAAIGPDESIFGLSLEAFDEVVRLNLQGTVLPSLVFGEAMAARGAGSIINISSMAAQRALTRVAGYSAAKAAVDSFTRWLAVEMALRHGEGVRVNAIAPGFFVGEQNRHLLLDDTGALTERGATIIRQTPMKRFGSPQELCGAAIWLASDAAAFVTGIVVPVDGGFNAYSGV
jgi:NAD(P)-dependent dehydrogenase (short-subunit alcohol dehydrogenase family)